MRRPRRNFAARVQVEELHRHLLDRGAGLVPLRCPAFSAQGVQARRWRFGGYVGRRSIPLDLVDAVERNVEPVAALVLDDGNFDRALAHEHLLDPAIDANAVLEMDDVVARLERCEALECAARRVSSRAAEASLTTEDLMVGENAITSELATRWNHEAAVEDANRKIRGRDAIIVEKLVETLGLAGVVTEDNGGDPVGDDLL